MSVPSCVDFINRTKTIFFYTRPNSKKCWVESSFVGTGRLVSPQTPPVLESQPSMPLSEDIRRYDITSAELSSVSLRYANASAAAIVDVTPRISTSGEFNRIAFNLYLLVSR